MPPSFRKAILRLVIPFQIMMMVFPSLSSSQIVGFFPVADSITVVGSCTPPSVISTVINAPGGADTISIQPMWDDRMYAGPPFGVPISRCFFLVADSLDTNQYQLWITQVWPDSGAPHLLNLDSTFSVWGRFFVSLHVIVGGGLADSMEVLFYADAFGSAGSEGPRGLPGATLLLQNYPNPFNTSTTLRYQLQTASAVTLSVYDLLGREVATLIRGELSPGTYSTRFDAGDLASGVFLCRLQAGDVIQSRKIISMK